MWRVWSQVLNLAAWLLCRVSVLARCLSTCGSHVRSVFLWFSSRSPKHTRTHRSHEWQSLCPISAPVVKALPCFYSSSSNTDEWLVWLTTPAKTWLPQFTASPFPKLPDVILDCLDCTQNFLSIYWSLGRLRELVNNVIGRTDGWTERAGLTMLFRWCVWVKLYISWYSLENESHACFHSPPLSRQTSPRNPRPRIGWMAVWQKLGPVGGGGWVPAASLSSSVGGSRLKNTSSPHTLSQAGLQEPGSGKENKILFTYLTILLKSIVLCWALE